VSRNDVILGAAALVLVVFSLVVSLVIPRRDAGFPGRNLKVFTLVAIALVLTMLAAVEVFGAEHEAEEGGEAAQTETGAEDGAGGEGQGGAGPEGDPAAGEEVYASAGCGSCHALQEAGSTATVGPNLDESSIDEAGAAQQVAEGGGGMPAFSGQLSEQQIQDVAAFVVASQG
jgi:mono/diheme cytochrome c family protein